MVSKTRLVIGPKGKQFLVKDTTQDLHTHFGIVKAKDLESPSGSVVKTHTNTEVTIIDATFGDLYDRINRGAQIIPRKDIALILTETMVGPNDIVIDAGAGSGGSACFLARYVKKVITCDIREDHLNIVKKNIDLLNLKNIEPKLHDITTGLPSKAASLLLLDVPAPWEVMEHTKVMKPNSWIVAYSPTVPQVADFVNQFPEWIQLHATKEIFDRDWEVKGRKVRPKSQSIGHSGFLTFARVISPESQSN